MLFTNEDSLIPVVKRMTKPASQTVVNPGATSSGEVSEVPPVHLIVLGEKYQSVGLSRSLLCRFLKRNTNSSVRQTPPCRV